MKKSLIMLAMLFCSICLSAQKPLAAGERKAGSKITAITRDSLESGIRKDTTISLYKNDKGSTYIVAWSEKTGRYYIIWLPKNKK